jgi:hypothetical protein
MDGWIARWNLYGLGPITNCEIPNKSQKFIHVGKKGCGNSLVSPCFVEVKVVILKYGSLSPLSQV